MDANSKLGPNIIPQDSHSQSPNGAKLSDIIKRHNLIVVNGMKICKGRITRTKNTKRKVEESTIDFVIVSRDLAEIVKNMIIDEERKHVLARITKSKQKVNIVESDHNTILTEFTLKWNEGDGKQRIEVMNLKNKNCQEKFKIITSNGKELSSIFDDNTKCSPVIF